MICDAPDAHLEWREALAPGHVLILGEMHGTREIPALAATAVCDALRSGHRVCLFVEWPTSLPETLDEETLRAFAFFRDDVQDGRRSRALLNLVLRAQTWAEQGAPVTVVPMDPVEGVRDAGMAAAVRTWIDAMPESVAIVLVGNIHARLTKGWRDHPDYEPLGYRLIDLGDRVRSLDVRYANGSAWNCSPDCGIHPLSGKSRGDDWMIEWKGSGAFDGTYYVGVPTPSPPAVQR